jgi:hypothetical protein
MKENVPVFDKRNYGWLLASLVVLFIGFILMASDKEPYGFGVVGLTIGPAVVLMGLILPFFSILRGNRLSGRRFGNSLFDTWNVLTGWATFALALTVYTWTLEPTTSFWDCGEFIASAYKLQVPHPPGAPLFLLVGRMFSLLAGSDVTRVAWWINMVSAISSAFTILFLFWTITLLAKKVLVKTGQTPGPSQVIIILGSGAVGALSYTFTDSFWFSAVEAEVYAFSSFFTAFVFWAMLKWEAAADPRTGYRWLILIAYMVGLSIGVHLLNLVAIPAMGFIYYYRYHSFSYRGALLTLGISLGLIAVIMWGIIPGLPAMAGSLEIFGVNVLGLSFGSGIVIFLALFFMAIIYLLRKAITRGQPLAQVVLLGFIYVLVGYSSYLIIPIRSGYNPMIDENNPEELLRFVSYLRREQYEQRPLLYGPQFSAELIDQQDGAPKYARGKNRYEVVDHQVVPVYDPKGMSLLPRLYSSTPSHLNEYKKWVSIREAQRPTMGQNLSYLFRYQLGHMYGRYFGWNFVGRDSDVQHAGVFWPWERDQDLPHEIAANKARNNYYMLPFLLGVLGCGYHLRKNKQDAAVVFFLFLFTGLAIAFFLNQPPVEPRERDYAYAGSFYAFAIWIGLGTLALGQLLEKVIRVRPVRTILTLLLSLAVPVLMAARGWDDHDRSGRFYAADFARNMLESCAPNAILFTNGDNDTFPLWYAQEVEGVRRDVRVIVLTYLNSDWYIEQMKRPAYESTPLPISLGEENFKFSTNNYLPYVARPQVKSGMDLRQFMALVRQNHPALQVQAQNGQTYLSVPTKSFYLPVDTAAVLRSGIVPKNREKEVIAQMTWSLPGAGLEKKQLVIYDILATNNWERPVYFAATASLEEMNFLKPYLQLEGLAYRVLPVKNPDPEAEAFVAKDLMRENMTRKFKYRNLQNPAIYYDNVYGSQVVPHMRRSFALLADSYLQAGDTGQARKIIGYSFGVLPDTSIPYDFYSPLYVELLVKVGEQKRADQLFDTLAGRAKRSIQYYSTQNNRHLFEREIQLNLMIIQQLAITGRNLNYIARANELEAFFMKNYYRL